MVILGFVLNPHPKKPEFQTIHMLAPQKRWHLSTRTDHRLVEVDGVSRAADQAKSVMRLVGGPQIQVAKRMEEMAQKGRYC